MEIGLGFDRMVHDCKIVQSCHCWASGNKIYELRFFTFVDYFIEPIDKMCVRMFSS